MQWWKICTFCTNPHIITYLFIHILHSESIVYWLLFSRKINIFLFKIVCYFYIHNLLIIFIFEHSIYFYSALQHHNNLIFVYILLPSHFSFFLFIDRTPSKYCSRRGTVYPNYLTSNLPGVFLFPSFNSTWCTICVHRIFYLIRYDLKLISIHPFFYF